MGLAYPLSQPIYSGTGSSSLVPSQYDCAINGLNFMVDRKYIDRFRRTSISLLKPQQDGSGNVSEQSLNPEEFARRAAESWHHGAGQSRLDRADSDPYRFNTSKGVDVWTKWKLTLLNATASKRSSSNTNLQLVAAGTYAYLADGNEVYSTTDLTTWTSRDVQDGESAQSVKSIATNGSTVYAALGSNGIHSGAAGSDFAHYSDLSCTLLGYVKGRLMAANGASIYNVTASGAAPSALLTLGTGFTWVGFAEGPSAVYCAGYSGDKSLVYRTAVKADGTALDVPVVAGELPDGEIIRSIQGYLGKLLVGTDKGVRVFDLDTSGNLTDSSKVIPTTAGVYCFEPQDRFVWYGLTNYDTLSTGLGRLDLGTFTDSLTPAYASDLMATIQGAVLSAITFGGVRVFAVSAAGVYAENAAAKVSSGTISSGLVGYGMADTKVAMYLDTRFETLPASTTVVVAIASDGGSFVTLDTAMTTGITSLVSAAGQYRAENFEVRLTLTGSAATAPTVTRWTMEANAAPGRGEYIDVPLLLFETVKDRHDKDQPLDVASAYSALKSLEALGSPASYQDGMGTELVFADDHEFIASGYTKKRDAWNGTYIVRLRNPRRRS